MRNPVKKEVLLPHPQAATRLIEKGPRSEDRGRGKSLVQLMQLMLLVEERP